MKIKNGKSKQAMLMALSMLIATGSFGSLPAIGSPRAQLQEPKAHTNSRIASEAPYQDNILLLMPNAKSSKDDTKKAIDECHGTVIGTIGSGDLQVLIMQTEKGKLAQTEQKLAKGKNFGLIQRNHQYAPSATWVPNDPEYSNQWHLTTINARRAWGNIQSSPAVYAGGSKIAVFDSGVNSALHDLNSYYKVDKGYDAMDAKVFANSRKGQYGADSDIYNGGASTDAWGHGTLVASTAAAHANNGDMGAGVAPGANIYPIRITNSMTGKGSDIGIVGGLLQLMKMHQDWATGLSGAKEKVTLDNDTKYENFFKNEVTNILTPKIVNISYDIMPDFEDNKLLQKYFTKFHDTYGGLLFVSAGNDYAKLTAPRYSYVNVISAVNRDLKKADFSNYGKCVTLTAPGVDIVCIDQNGKKATVDGTSFAAPIVAAVASMIWGANPKLSNTRVEEILKRTAVKPASGTSDDYGDGLVDAEAAMKASR